MHTRTTSSSSSRACGQRTLEKLYGQLAEPEELPVERLNKAPNGPEVPLHCVPPAMIFVSSGDVADPKIMMSDFGEAFFHSEEEHTTL